MGEAGLKDKEFVHEELRMPSHDYRRSPILGLV